MRNYLRQMDEYSFAQSMFTYLNALQDPLINYVMQIGGSGSQSTKILVKHQF